MSSNIYENLQQLGGQTALPDSPETAVLERVENPQAGTPYAVRFTAPEFTSLCPMTGQPDFAHLVIDYVPDAWLVESNVVFPLATGAMLSRARVLTLKNFALRVVF